jgi:hypothetical protein
VPPASEVVEHDARPPLLGSVGALVSGLAVVVLLSESFVGLPAALVGVAFVGIGLWRASGRLVALGATVLFGAVLVVGLGRGPLWVLGATVPVVLAWALAGHAVRLGQQVGRRGETWRVETVQAVATLVVVVVAGGVGYLGYRTITGSQSPLAIALLLGSVIAATLVLR